MLPAKWSGKMQANAYRVASEKFGPISMLRAIYITPEWARVRMGLHLALGNDRSNKANAAVMTMGAIGTFRERESQSSDSRVFPDAVDRVSINAAWPESPANFKLW